MMNRIRILPNITLQLLVRHFVLFLPSWPQLGMLNEFDMSRLEFLHRVRLADVHGEAEAVDEGPRVVGVTEVVVVDLRFVKG